MINHKIFLWIEQLEIAQITEIVMSVSPASSVNPIGAVKNGLEDEDQEDREDQDQDQDQEERDAVLSHVSEESETDNKSFLLRPSSDSDLESEETCKIVQAHEVDHKTTHENAHEETLENAHEETLEEVHKETLEDAQEDALEDAH